MMMADPVAFLEKLKSFDVQTVSEAPLTKVETLLAQPWFSVDVMKGKSFCSAYMAAWVIQCVSKRRLIDRLERVRGGAPSAKTTAPLAAAEEVRAKDAMVAIKMCDIGELKCLAKPPASIACVLQAVTQLLAGIDKRIQVDHDGAPISDSWGVSGKALLGDPKLLMDWLSKFPGLMDSGAVPEANFTRARAVRDAMGGFFAPEHMKKVCVAVEGLCTWVCHILQKHDLTKESFTGIAEQQASAPQEGKVVADDGFTLIAVGDTCSTEVSSERMSPVASTISGMSAPVSPSRQLSPELWARKQQLEDILNPSVTLQDMQEMKCHGKPPAEVKLVLDAVAHLLMGSDTGGKAKMLLSNPRAFVARTQAFRASVEEGQVLAESMAKASEVSKQLCPDRVAKSSRAAMGLCKWVHAAIEYHELWCSEA